MALNRITIMAQKPGRIMAMDYGFESRKNHTFELRLSIKALNYSEELEG